MNADTTGLREEIIAALEQPVHAPMGDHHVVTGECQSCPWPLHMVEGPSGIADAVLALLAAHPDPTNSSPAAGVPSQTSIAAGEGHPDPTPEPSHQLVRNGGPDALDTCTGCDWESWDTAPSFAAHADHEPDATVSDPATLTDAEQDALACRCMEPCCPQPSDASLWSAQALADAREEGRAEGEAEWAAAVEGLRGVVLDRTQMVIEGPRVTRIKVDGWLDKLLTADRTKALDAVREQAKAEVLREAAADIYACFMTGKTLGGPTDVWLRARADRLGGQS